MAKYRVTATGLNVRSGPGTGYESLTVLPKTEVIISPDIAGWLPVEMEGGEFGWASAQFLERVDDAPEPEESPIATPPVGKVIFQSQLTSLFGKPRDPAPYLKIMDFTEFKGNLPHVIDYLGNKWGFRIYGHELLGEPMRKALYNLVNRGHGGEFTTYDGCLNIRQMTGGGGYSVHSWGLAVDVNAGSNPYGRKPTLSAGFVRCFEDAGFEWGGRWRTPDGMHFQIPRTS